MMKLFFGLCCFLYSCSAVFEVSYYQEVTACIFTDDVFDSSILNMPVGSYLDCATACAKDRECESFKISHDSPFTCVLHNRTLQSQSCSQYNFKEFRSYNDINSPCLNGGIHEPDSGCRCFYGYIGARCETLMRDCAEGRTSGHYVSGGHFLMAHPDGSPDPFLVRCTIRATFGRTVLMTRKGGTVSFNRPWADYKSGFGDLKTEFWLGLDRMHYLTTSREQKFIVAIQTRMPNGAYTYRFHDYAGFRIGDESTGYAFDFDSHWSRGEEQALGDCLSALKGKKFTTTDVDNDDNPDANCASLHEGGWWFTGCGDCNPTGPMVKTANGYRLNITNEAFWKPGIPTYSLTQVKLFFNR